MPPTKVDFRRREEAVGNDLVTAESGDDLCHVVRE